MNKKAAVGKSSITFKVVVRKQRKDGCYPVYIRVTNNRQIAYMKTGYVVTSSKGDEVIDERVLLRCQKLINNFVECINDIDYSLMSATEIISFLEFGNKPISFTEYANEYILKMKLEGRLRPANNYQCSINNLSSFFKKDNINFNELTYSKVQGWIDSLKNTSRARRLYPTCIKTIFNAGCLKYNDYDSGRMIIKNQPFSMVDIPRNKRTAKKAITSSEIKKIFETKPSTERATIAQSAMKISFSLAGINTADLYDLPTSSINNLKLSYRRKKTREKRDDSAYSEITIPQYIMNEVMNNLGTDGEHLFNYAERYLSPEIFNDCINRGLKQLSKDSGIADLTTYTFRRTWATIAINECNASMDDVAFALNHVSAHRVTEGYITPDYSRIDRLNEKIIELIEKERE